MGFGIAQRMTERQVQFWPLSKQPDFEGLAKITQDTMQQADMTVAETAAGVLLSAAASMPPEPAPKIVGLEAEKQRAIAAHAYRDTLLTFAHAAHRLKGTPAADLASELARLRLYDLADLSRKTHPRLLEILGEEAVGSPEDFMNQNLINLLPQDLQFEAIGIVRAHEHFSLLIAKIIAQKIKNFPKGN